MKEALKIRREKKKKKPNFVRRDYPKKKKLGKKWRQAKGRHSQTRKKRRGYRKQPSIGYSSPRKVRGLHASGLKTIMIKNPNQVKNLEEGQGVIIGKIGLKKKIEILKKLVDKNLMVVNVRDVKEFIKKAEEKIAEKKKTVKEEEEKKKKTKEETGKEKKKEKKEKTEEEAEKEKKKEQRQKAMQQPIKK